MAEKEKSAVAKKVDADYSLEAVPESARKGFSSMFFVMLGFTFFSASMSVGAKLGNGLDLSGFIWSCILGGLILSAYCGLLAYIGSTTGLNMDLLCRRTFGARVLTCRLPFWVLRRLAGLAWVLPCFPSLRHSSWGSMNGCSPSLPVC